MRVSRMSARGPNPTKTEGQSMFALPFRSDIHLFCYCKCVIDFYSEIADRALDFCMPQQKLHGSQIAGATIDERGLGSEYVGFRTIAGVNHG